MLARSRLVHTSRGTAPQRERPPDTLHADTALPSAPHRMAAALLQCGQLSRAQRYEELVAREFLLRPVVCGVEPGG